MDQLNEAIRFHDWYAAAAILLGGVVFMLRKASPALWQKLPDGWRWLPPVVGAGAAGFISAHAAGKPLAVALLEACNAVFFVGLPAAGGHSVFKELAHLKRPVAPTPKEDEGEA